MSSPDVIAQHMSAEASELGRAAAMYLQIAAKTDKGRQRRRNEDRAAAKHVELGGVSACLLAVADGVGGSPGGHLASELAMNAIVADIQDSNFDGGTFLQARFQSATQSVAATAAADARYQGMATTLVVALLTPKNLWVANVGDSRAYFVRDDSLTQITTDHSLVAERVSAGLISSEEAATSPHRNVVTRTLGSTDYLDVDIFDCGGLSEGHCVLLCSDGLYNMLSDTEIALCATSLPPLLAVDELIRQSNVRGGFDNIAVAIARFADSDFNGDRNAG